MDVREVTAFADILDELIAEHSASVTGGAAPAVDHLAVAEELHSGRISVGSADAAQAYFEAAADIAFVPDAPPVEAPMPLPADRASIAAELGLSGGETQSQLDAIRRNFALRNHPDRVCAALHENAMTRMQIANMLIDAAKATATTR